MLDEYDDRQQQGHYKHTLDSATAGRFQTLLWGAGSTGNSGDGSRDIYGVVGGICDPFVIVLRGERGQCVERAREHEANVLAPLDARPAGGSA